MTNTRDHPNGTPRWRFRWVLFGFLLQWPTILTVPMFPILVVMYAHLARAEEREALA